MQLRNLACVVRADLFDLRFVASFGLRKVLCEVLHLRFVPTFGLRQMSCEFFDFGPVTRFGLLKEFTVKLLNLCDSFGNKRL